MALGVVSWIPAQTGHFPPPGAYGYHRHKWCCQTGRTQTDKIWGGPDKTQRRTATTTPMAKTAAARAMPRAIPRPRRGRRSGLDTFSYISDIGVLHCRTAAYFSKAGLRRRQPCRHVLQENPICIIGVRLPLLVYIPQKQAVLPVGGRVDQLNGPQLQERAVSIFQHYIRFLIGDSARRPGPALVISLYMI